MTQQTSKPSLSPTKKPYVQRRKAQYIFGSTNYSVLKSHYFLNCRNKQSIIVLLHFGNLVFGKSFYGFVPFLLHKALAVFCSFNSIGDFAFNNSNTNFSSSVNSTVSFFSGFICGKNETLLCVSFIYKEMGYGIDRAETN